MTPTDQDELMDDLSRQLRAAGDRVRVPGDGEARVADRVHARRTRRRMQTGLAALASIAVLVAGVAVISGSPDQDGAPVMAGPNPAAELTSPVAPLAPTGVPWSVDVYVPRGFDTLGGGPPAADMTRAYAIVGFDRDGYRWNLMIRSGASSTGGDEVATVGDKQVSLAVDDNDPTRVNEATWTDPSGDTVYLVGQRDIPEPVPDAVSFSGPWVEVPTPDEMRAVVETIQPVDLATWRAAIAPPAGGADSRTGSTAQPLRLGLDAAPGSTQIFLKPWSNASSILDVDGYGPGAFKLSVELPDSDLATDPAAVNDAEVEDVTVRGVDAQLVTGPFWPGADVGGGSGRKVALGKLYESPDGGGTSPYPRVLAWDEGGSQVRLEIADSVTTDRALAVANALVVLDDARWNQLLFPAISDGHMTTEDEGEPGVAAHVPRATPIEEVLPLLAPTDVPWQLDNYEPAIGDQTPGYSIGFERDGNDWSLLVGDTEGRSSQFDPREHIEHDNPLVQVGDRQVELIPFATSGWNPPEDVVVPVGAISAARWTDDTGAGVLLSDVSIEHGGYFDQEAVVRLVASITDLPVDEWSRPIVDGLRSQAGVLLAHPTDAPSKLLVSSPGGVQLTYGVKDGPFMHATFGQERPAGQPTPTDEIDVRGERGLSGLAMDESALGPISRPFCVIEWLEHGSRVAIDFPSSVTTDQAIVLANSLVAPTTGEWMEILGLSG